jgi:lysophospholipase L1-like esterase
MLISVGVAGASNAWWSHVMTCLLVTCLWCSTMDLDAQPAQNGVGTKPPLTSRPPITTASTSNAAATARFYISPDTAPADIGVGDYLTKWLMPVMDLEQRDRYAQANRALGPAAADRPRVVFLGDSITDGWKALENLSMGSTPHRVINRGISGQLSTHLLWRLQADALSLNPKVLVVLIGTNDIRVGSNWNTQPTALQVQRLKDNLITLVDAARARGVRVVVGTLPPVHDDTFDPKDFPVRNSVLRSPAVIEEVNTWLRDVAAVRGLPVADYHAALRDARGLLRRELSDDGLHPNVAGYAQMQSVVTPLVAQELMR